MLQTEHSVIRDIIFVIILHSSYPLWTTTKHLHFLCVLPFFLLKTA